ncbi:MAG: hypothetical protein M5T52_04240 [Ignavibacteriaceae bacterium]|nr:hypothetical protein [Ignavibacteriaceae bacterium]
MNNKEDLKRLLDFYLFSDLDDEAELDQYLSENSINYVEVSNKISDLLRQKRAELLLKKGREFKERYLQLKNDSYIAKSETGFPDIKDGSLAFAFRGKSDDNEEASDTDSFLLELIKKARENEKSN